jgi:diguanylate cyclase (GGDEF)-like protein
MRLPLPSVGNKIAWRIFARFVLASLVPIAVLAVLFYTEVSRSLEQRATAELDDASRRIGQLILDKLITTSDLLAATEQPRDEAQMRAFGLDAVRYERAGSVVAFGTFDPPHLPAIDPGKPALLIRDGENGTEVVIAVALSDGVAIGRFDRDYLRSATVLASSGMEACVFAESLRGKRVFCTASAFESMRAQVASPPPAGDLTWSDGDATWLAAYWELFTPSRFDTQPWFVVVAKPHSAAHESLSMFQLVAPQTLVLSVLLSLLLAFSQIRRTLQPLNQLVEGTRRIAAQDFETRTRVTGNDEFGSLGRAMDDMAERLGRQFGTLTTLAAIDRLILSSDDIEEVAEAALARIAATFHGCGVAVLLTDTSHDLRGRLYRRGAAGAGETSPTRIELSSDDRATLLACGDGRVLDEGPAHAPCLERLGMGSRTGSGVFVSPILRGRALGGALLATLPPGVVDERDLSLLRELAARLAVAVASSERERALFQRAHFDPVTGMPNRQLCYDRLCQALVQARRDEHRVAVLFIDLDGFKNINDSLGHIAGDDLLKEMALRLCAAVRETDTVARVGGDEYVAILPHVQTTLEVDAVVSRAMAAMQRPFVSQGRENVISGSIGVTIFPEDGSSAEEMLRKADMAMYSAKASGRSRCVYFTTELDRRLQERLALGSDLHKAIRNRELYLVYQPQVSLDGSRVVSAEALLRWRHPTRGLLPPDLFVPIMEESGLIESVGTWVLQTALHTLAEWRVAGLALPRISVNVAARQVLATGFADIVDEALQSANLGPENLELELTETTLVQDLSLANTRMAALAARGVRIAIDDFGTGYSSLGYLNELTFDALKVDRAFVVNLPAEKAVAIVKAIVAVAHALGKEVVAEGVESELQRNQLTKLRCDLAQGYLFSAPLEAEAFAQWLRQSSLTPPAQRRAVSR